MYYKPEPLEVVVKSSGTTQFMELFNENDSKTQRIQLHDHLGNKTYVIHKFFIMKDHKFLINRVEYYLVMENISLREEKEEAGVVFGYVKITDVE